MLHSRTTVAERRINYSHLEDPLGLGPTMPER